MKINTVLAPLSAIVLFALCGSALAVPATIVADTTLIARPRAGAAELTGLPQGTMVDLRRCERDLWCFVEADGRNGWVPMASLAFDLLPTQGAPAAAGGGGGSKQTPMLVGGLQDLLGGQNSGPQMTKVGPGITVASNPITRANAGIGKSVGTNYPGKAKLPGDGK